MVVKIRKDQVVTHKACENTVRANVCMHKSWCWLLVLVAGDDGDGAAAGGVADCW